MVGESDSFIVGGAAIGQAILDIIKDARELVVVVSPYLDICNWEGAQKSILMANRQESDVSPLFIVRADNQGDSTRESVQWLRDHGIEVFEVEGLHAKLYFNEDTFLLSSMNLLHSSLGNIEIATIVTDERERIDILTVVFRMVADAKSMALCAGCGVELVKRDSTKPLCRACYSRWKRENHIP